MRYAVIAVLVLAGCGRIGFDPLADRTADDAGVDAAIDIDARPIDGAADADLDGAAADGDADAAFDADTSISDAASDAATDADASISDACSPCDPIAQCGCAAAEACYLPMSGDPTACSAAGTGVRGEPCAIDGDCAPGFACQLFLAPTGVCERYCRTNEECDELCAEVVLGASVGACQSRCNPLTTAGCPAPLACRTAIVFGHGGDMQIGVGCGANEGVGDGAPCARLGDCAPGFACVNFECSPLCIVGEGACSCQKYSTYGAPSDLVVNGVEYGVCLPT